MWGPEDDDDVCELCGGSRYDDDGKPKEYFVHFPLKERLESLLQCPQYVKEVSWEYNNHRHNDRGYMTDVYDSPWVARVHGAGNTDDHEDGIFVVNRCDSRIS